MDGPRPIELYGDSISILRGLLKEFREWSGWSPLRHQLIVWQGQGDPPISKDWEKFLLEVGIFPHEAIAPDEKTEFQFLPDASMCNGFRWRETSHIRDGEYDILWEFEQLTLSAHGALSRMLRVHDWCLPGTECRLPGWFLPGRDPPFGLKYLWLQFLYDRAAEWPPLPDAPPWMPMTRTLVGKKAKAKLIECRDVWMLSAEAISRWLPADVDDFMSAWKSIPKPAPKEDRPHWDAARRLLTYKGKDIKRLTKNAKNLEIVVQRFEETHWSRPVTEKELWNHTDKKWLDSAMRELNKRHITPGLMHFEMKGTIEITWGSGPKPPRKTAK